MCDEVIWYVAREDYGFDVGVVLEPRNNVCKAVHGVLAPDVDLGIGVVEGDLQDALLGLVSSKAAVRGEVEGRDAGGKEEGGGCEKAWAEHFGRTWWWYPSFPFLFQFGSDGWRW